MSSEWGSLGHIARYHAELEIFKLALKKGYKQILIMEDDIHFRPDFIEKLKKSFNELPSDWDVFHFDCHNQFRDPEDPHDWQGTSRPKCFSSSYPNDPNSKRFVTEPFSKHLRIVKHDHIDYGGIQRGVDLLHVSGTYAYVISERGMKIYLKYAKPMTAATNVQLGLLSFGKQHKFNAKGDRYVVNIPSKDRLKMFVAKPRLVCAQTNISTTNHGVTRSKLSSNNKELCKSIII